MINNQIELLREMIVEEKGPLARATNMQINSLVTDINELRSCLISLRASVNGVGLNIDSKRIARILERTS